MANGAACQNLESDGVSGMLRRLVVAACRRRPAIAAAVAQGWCRVGDCSHVSEARQINAADDHVGKETFRWMGSVKP